MRSLTKLLIKPFLPESVDGREVTAVFGGGFKPPTSGHLLVIQKAIEDHPEIDNVIIYVGGKVRGGITQDQSFRVWDEHYKQLIDRPVRVEKSTAPIGDIYRYAKDNVEDKVYWIIGAREGREDDLQDIASRSSSLDKYPNLHLHITPTPNGGMSGTNARKALKMDDKEIFKTFIPDNTDQDEVWNILTSQPLNESITVDMDKVNKDSLNDIEGSDTFDYPKHIKSLTKYMLDKGINLRPLPIVSFVNDDEENARDFFGKTAHYDPNNYRIVLYTLNRHPKDVMRSFAHEMIHHHQNCEDRLGNITTQNTNEEGDLPEIEREAYEKGNMAFRSWTDTLTEGVLKEGRYDTISNQISGDIFNFWKEDFDEGEKDSTYEDTYDFPPRGIQVKAQITFKPGFGKLKIDGGSDYAYIDKKTGEEYPGYVKVDFIVDPKMIPEFYEEISMNLKDVVRHEIEHITQSGDSKIKNEKFDEENDLLIRALVKADIIPQAEYFKLPKEVDANLQGMYFRAKKEKRPFADVINTYLDAQDITPEEKQMILDLWRSRRKALSLPEF